MLNKMVYVMTIKFKISERHKSKKDKAVMPITNHSVPMRFQALVPSKKRKTKIPVYNTNSIMFLGLIKS
jgi:hypothetical protein